MADVRKRRGAQKRVGDRVKKGVRIGMAVQALFKGDPHAAQPERAPFFRR